MASKKRLLYRMPLWARTARVIYSQDPRIFINSLNLVVSTLWSIYFVFVPVLTSFLRSASTDVDSLKRYSIRRGRSLRDTWHSSKSASISSLELTLNSNLVWLPCHQCLKLEAQIRKISTSCIKSDQLIDFSIVKTLLCMTRDRVNYWSSSLDWSVLLLDVGGGFLYWGATKQKVASVLQTGPKTRFTDIWFGKLALFATFPYIRALLYQTCPFKKSRLMPLGRILEILRAKAVTWLDWRDKTMPTSSVILNS